MIQIITHNDSKFENFSNNYKISSLDEFDSFDDFEINIVDLSDGEIWRNKENNKIHLNSYLDLLTIKKEIETSIKCKIILVLPQNCYYRYYYGINNYNKSIKIKDMLTEFIDIISKYLVKIEGFDITYSKNETIIRNSTYKSDFNFNFENSEAFDTITKSKSSNKSTSIIYKNVILTTLNIFETSQHLLDYIDIFLCDSSEKLLIPEWIDSVDFFDDKVLKADKLANNKKIELLQEKNKEIDNRLEYNNRIKSILYTTGDELVEIVMEILDTILESDSSNFIDKKKEDFFIRKESVTFVGEIKGVSQAAANKYVSQLDVHVQSYIDEITEKCLKENVKGLLIINHQRDKNISERNEVHKNQIDLAVRNGSLIIESTTLLFLYEKFLEKKIDTRKIEKIFTEKVGILLKTDLKL